MKNAVIHIGANKTASTTLQRALFSQHHDLHYVGEDADGYENYSDIVNAMAGDDDLHFPKRLCQEFFQRHLKLAQGKTFLYSNEDIMTSRTPALCAQRLKSMVPNAQVLLVIRDQNAAIPSFYASHGAFLKPAPPSYFRRHVSFDDWMRHQTTFIKYGALASYFYNKQIKLYADLYGEENTHVLLFEEFINDKPIFVEKLCHILNINYEQALQLLGERHERKGVTSRMFAYNRFRTSFFWGVPFTNYLPGGKKIATVFQNFIESGPRVKIEMPKFWKDKIFELYAEDNKALASTYNLPLDKYQYPLA